jgi:hypothetical protein
MAEMAATIPIRPKANPDAVAAIPLGFSSLINREIIGVIICGAACRADRASNNGSISLDLAKRSRLLNEALCPWAGRSNFSLTKKSTMRPPEKRRPPVIKKAALYPTLSAIKPPIRGPKLVPVNTATMRSPIAKGILFLGVKDAIRAEAAATVPLNKPWIKRKAITR